MSEEKKEYNTMEEGNISSKEAEEILKDCLPEGETQ